MGNLVTCQHLHHNLETPLPELLSLRLLRTDLYLYHEAK